MTGLDMSAAHIGFVLTAYALTFVVLLGLIVVIAADLKAQRTALAKLEDAGAPRRRRATSTQKAKT